METMLSLYTETLEDLLENQGYGTDNQSQSLTEILALMDKFPRFVFGENLNLSMKDLFMDKYDIREIGAETEELFIHYWKERTNALLIEYTPKIQMWLDNFKDLFKFTVTLELSETVNREKTEDKDKTRTDNLSKSTSNTRTDNLSKSTSNTRTDDLSKSTSNTRTDNLTENKEYTYYLNPVNTGTNLKVQELTRDNKTNTGTQGNIGSETNTGTQSNSGSETNTGTQSNSGSETNTGTQRNVEDNSESEEKTREMSRDVLQSVWGKTRAQLLEQILELKSVYVECLDKFETIFMGVL